MQFVTQAEIQCEPGSNFPVILAKETIALASAIHCRVIDLFGIVGVVGIAQQKCGVWISDVNGISIDVRILG